MAVVFSFANTIDNNNWGGYVHRNVANTLTGGGTQVRVRFVASSSSVFVTNHCSIAVVGAATAPNTTATPVELLFGGVSGFSLAAGATILSDWANLTFLSSDKLLVDMDMIAGTTGLKYGTGVTGDAYYKVSSGDYNNATVSGYTQQTGYIRGFDQIEGQTPSGDGADKTGSTSCVVSQ